MIDTPTPRTDAAQFPVESTCVPMPTEEYVVPADFARELECENARLIAENKECRVEIHRLWRELIEWQGKAFAAKFELIQR